jgi:hypothetical protein
LSSPHCTMQVASSQLAQTTPAGGRNRWRPGSSFGPSGPGGLHTVSVPANLWPKLIDVAANSVAMIARRTCVGLYLFDFVEAFILVRSGPALDGLPGPEQVAKTAAPFLHKLSEQLLLQSVSARLKFAARNRAGFCSVSQVEARRMKSHRQNGQLHAIVTIDLQRMP